METLGYYNGTIGEILDVSVPMADRACYFGDGIYDAGYAHNHRVYCLDEHMDRFFNSAGLMRIEVPYTKEELKQLIQDLTPYLEGQENLETYMDAIEYTSQNNVEEEGIWAVPSEVSTRDATEPLAGVDPNSAIYLRWDLYKELGYPEINTLEDLLPVFQDMMELCPTSDSGQPTNAISLFKDWDGSYVSNVAELSSMYGYDRVGYAFHKADGSGEIQDIMTTDSEYMRAIRFFNQANQMGLVDPESTTQN